MSTGLGRLPRLLLALLIAAALIRLLSLAAFPLMDTTEARYAEIGRKMAELGDWITPRHTMGEPFWGKPPLSFWLTAASFRLFGVNEFAARLPHYLCALAVGLLVWGCAIRRSSREALIAVSLLAGSALFFISAGAVMTDMSLVVGTTLAMVGFWASGQGPGHSRQRNRWLPFIGLAIGLLAKGPLALVLIAGPLLLWTLLTPRVPGVWKRLPWAGGMVLVLVTVLPWYALAEMRTPGFLDYFLLGEHWHRFTTPGWTGDLYGTAHRVTPGTIWLFAFAAWLPWSVLLPVAAWRLRRDAAAPAVAADSQWQRYLLIWAAVPLVLFTPARNIIWTYVLPAMPALSLWMAAWLARQSRPARVDALVATGLAVALVGAIGLGVHMQRSGRVEGKAARAVVAAYDARRTPGQPLVFVGPPSHSAAFYSHGTAQQVREPAALTLQDRRDMFVAMRVGAPANWPSPERLSVSTVGRFGGYDLFLIKPTGAASRPVRAGQLPPTRSTEQ